MPKKATTKCTSRQKTSRTVQVKTHGRSVKRTARGTSLTPAGRTLSERVSVDDAGRVVVPAKIRKTLGIEGGQELTMSLEGDVITLQTLHTAVRRAQALAREKRTTQGSVVDDFLAERRAEAGKE